MKRVVALVVAVVLFVGLDTQRAEANIFCEVEHIRTMHFVMPPWRSHLDDWVLVGEAAPMVRRFRNMTHPEANQYRLEHCPGSRLALP